MSDKYVQVNETLLGHIDALRELGKYAFALGDTETELSERRKLDRIGIRANDLLIAITEYVSNNT